MALPAEVPELELEHINSGKVRESYLLDSEHLLFVTTDRISAFDVVMAEEIPNKGRILNAMTDFWLNELVDVVPSQDVPIEEKELPDELGHPYFLGRISVAKKAEMLPIECIVRGHLTGSAWKEYWKTHTVHGMFAPAMMQESEKFPQFMFTPSTKAEQGEHDVNISFDDAAGLVGSETAEYLKDVSTNIFRRMYERTLANGIVLADTKFEFGRLADGTIILCDEVGTPDSSRFWPADKVVVGETPPSFDKQFVRDYLDSTGWDRLTLPPPQLPPHIIAQTAEKYEEAYSRVTGLNISIWPGYTK